MRAQSAGYCLGALYSYDASLTVPIGNTAEQPQEVLSPSPGVEEGNSEEWETIGYEETEEGRKAKHIASGHFQITYTRKKKRLFSYHWNVRKY